MSATPVYLTYPKALYEPYITRKESHLPQLSTFTKWSCHIPDSPSVAHLLCSVGDRSRWSLQGDRRSDLHVPDRPTGPRGAGSFDIREGRTRRDRSARGGPF